MKLTILGSSAGFAGKNDGCSSYLLTTGDHNYLIDLGPGSLSELQNHVGYRDLDAVFISHLHADHVSDIYTFRFALFAAQRDGSMPHPLPLYLPDEPEDTFAFIEKQVAEQFLIHVVTEESCVQRDDIRVDYIGTNHSLTALAMRFAYGNKTLVYTADTAFFDDLVPFCAEADLLLAEATLQDKDKDLETSGHMTARTAATLAQRANAKTLLLTHIWPEYDRSVSLNEARTCFEGQILMAERGAAVHI
jgi:ribonuclease BN (tRNA processing enzyme)